MEKYFTLNEWSIIQDSFRPEHNRIGESVCSLGNGRMGHRANFEEKFSGDTLPGHYVAGIYSPVNNRGGRRENVFPEEYPINVPSWIGIDVEIEGYTLDLATCQVLEFRRELNMREGYLYRRAQVRLPDGKELEINSLRFTSLADDELGAIRYAVTPLNFNSSITFTPYLGVDVKNSAGDNAEKVWQEISRSSLPGEAYITTQTQPTHIQVCTGMRLMLEKDGSGVETTVDLIEQEYYVANKITAIVEAGQEFVLYKYAAVVSSGNYSIEKLPIACELALDRATSIGFAQLLEAHGEVWTEKWQESDVIIKGDLAAQQAIRFNIFQLHQAYTGEDAQLYISASGFTGTTGGGQSLLSTEAYCLPFYLATAPPQAARNLLLYRYHLLPQAIENAKNLGFLPGAAMYFMKTPKGEELLNPREVNSAALHQNGVLTFAIYDYIRFSGDTNFLSDYGLEILIAISRFWAQWFNQIAKQQQNALLSVTGPNQNLNQVLKKKYTNILGTWCLEFTLTALQQVQDQYPERYTTLLNNLNFEETTETKHWREIIKQINSFVEEEAGNLFPEEGLQDEAPLFLTDYIWLALLLSEDRFNLATLRRNFEFYVPQLGPESPLSTCVHAILSARMGKAEQAFSFYQKTARLFLDNVSTENVDGCHIPTLAGNWLTLVKGFGGMRIRQNTLHLHPMLPPAWEKYTFKIRYREHLLTITVTKPEVKILNESAHALNLQVYETEQSVGPNAILTVKR